MSRLLCSPEYPTWPELSYVLEHGSTYHALRKDPALNHLHWATTRRPQPETLMALAIDHRTQLAAIADRVGAPRERINGFKRLAVAAAARVADGRPGYGVLLDEAYGREALFDCARLPFWVGRPVELPGSRPLRFEFDQDIGGRLAEWPVTHTIKCLAFYHPDDEASLKAEQAGTLRTLYDAARRNGLELLVEIVSCRNGPIESSTTATVLDELYRAGIKPDWWKLETQSSPAAWREIEAVIKRNDPWCRGVVLLGLEAPEGELEAAFAACRDAPIVKGFAIGRTIFNDAADKWLAGRIGDDEAIDDMARRFLRLTNAWLRVDKARAA